MMTTKYTAKFADGTEISVLEGNELQGTRPRKINNRLDFYNWVCLNRLGKEYGPLQEITCEIFPK